MNVPSDPKSLVGVIIADADKNTRAFYNTALAKHGGFKIWTAANCEDAIMTLREVNVGDISIAVFDLAQESLGGHLLLQKLRTDPRFYLIEILMCSDAFSEQDAFMLKEFDINFTIKKGVGVAEFIKKILEIYEYQVKVLPKKKLLKELEFALTSGNLEDCNKIAQDPELSDTFKANKEFVHYKAEIHLANEETEQAINVLTDYLKAAEPGSGETFRTLSTLGKALCKAKKFDDAMVVFDKLAQKSPKNLGHKVAWGDALLEKGDPTAAQEKFNQVLQEDPSNKEAKVGVGKSLMAQGHTKEAMNMFTAIKEPIESYSLASYFNNVAVSMVKNNKTDEAIEMYENAIQFFDKFKPNIYFNLGLAWLKRSNYSMAAKCFDEVIKYSDDTFISKKTLLQEYKNNGMDFIVKKYGKSLEKVSTSLPQTQPENT